MANITLEELDSKIDKLTEMVKVLGLMMKNNTTNTSTVSTQTEVKKLISIDKTKLSEILHSILGQTSDSESKFLNSIVHSKYHTVTTGQMNVLDSILDKHNYKTEAILA